MKSPGHGSVTPLGPDRFWARGPRPKRVSLGVYKTREEAEDVRRAAVQELARADRTRAPGVSLRDFAARYLDERETDGDHCMAQRRSRWKHVERAEWIDDPIDSISRVTIVTWIKTLKRTRVTRGGVDRRLSRHMVRFIVSQLSQVFAAALDEGLCAQNPAAGHRITSEPRDGDEAEVWAYLDANEQRALLTNTEIPETDRLAIGFAIGTGLRHGEQFNLELRDLHVDGPRPHVYVRWGSKGRKPKNGKARSVPLFGIGLAAARRWLEILPTFAKKNPDKLVFPAKSGARRRVHLLRGSANKVNGFRNALRTAGITRRVRWHDLRHTCASSLIARWWGRAWSIEEIRDMLGHCSSRITERYAHLAPARIGDIAAETPGLHAGYAAPVPPLALVAKNSPPSVSAGAEWCGPPCNEALGAIPRGSVDDNPAVTRTDRDLAIEGLRALARDDLDEAKDLALRLACGGEPTSLRLCDFFEAAIVGDAGARRRA